MNEITDALSASHDAIPARPQRDPPVLAIVVPCYNEQAVLPLSAPQLVALIDRLAEAGSCQSNSFIIFVDDGSRDGTWPLLQELVERFKGRCRALRLATNSGHQNALLAGIEYASTRSDASVSIDADLQDDLAAVETMLERYRNGDEIVLGVRSDRSTDSWFKKLTATIFYKLMRTMGVEATPQHADFRLLSKAAMVNLQRFTEYHVYLRGFPHVLHSRISHVYYCRSPRLAVIGPHGRVRLEC